MSEKKAQKYENILAALERGEKITDIKRKHGVGGETVRALRDGAIIPENTATGTAITEPMTPEQLQGRVVRNIQNQIAQGILKPESNNNNNGNSTFGDLKQTLREAAELQILQKLAGGGNGNSSPEIEQVAMLKQQLEQQKRDFEARLQESKLNDLKNAITNLRNDMQNQKNNNKGQSDSSINLATIAAMIRANPSSLMNDGPNQANPYSAK